MAVGPADKIATCVEPFIGINKRGTRDGVSEIDRWPSFVALPGPDTDVFTALRSTFLVIFNPFYF